jgi:hypothetical protein
MNTLYLLNILNFIFPFVMILVGLILKKHPVDQIGSNGYSTPTSRKSQKTWDYAQSIAPDILIYVGKVLALIILIFTIISITLRVNVDHSVSISMLLGGAGLFLSYIMIESKLNSFQE